MFKMFRKLFHTARSAFKRLRSGKSNEQISLPTLEFLNDHHAEPGSQPSGYGEGIDPHDAIFSKMAQQQLREQTESQSVQRVLIIPAGPMMLGKGEKRAFTSDGLVNESTEILVQTVEGRLVQADEVKGQCQVCGGYSNTVFQCSACSISICGLCSRVYKDAVVCSKDYKTLMFHHDTWEDS